MRVVVTGAAGFVGRAVVMTLLKQENHVVGLDVKECPDWWPKEAEYVRGDVRDQEAARACCHGSGGVVHLAAEPGIQVSLQEPRRTADVNVMGTVTMLEAAKVEGVEAFSFASSCATLRELRTGAFSPYAASKCSGEEYCRAFGDSFGLRTSILRLSNVYGPGSLHKGSAVAGLIKGGLTDGRLPVTGDGLQTRDFIYVDDVAKAFCTTTVSQIAGEFIVSSGKSTSILDLAQAIADRLQLGADAVEHKPALSGDTRSVYLDSSRTRRELGWRVQVDLQSGLDLTISWFRQALAGRRNPK